MVAITVGAFLLVRAARKVPLWLVTVFAVLFLVGFLTWAAAGATVPLVGLLAGALTVSTPLIFGSLGGVISERVGVVNIAIEGQLLGGAFMAALVASVTGNASLGLLGAMVAGVLVSFVLAAFAIKYFVDQVIVGVVLNVLVHRPHELPLLDGHGAEPRPVQLAGALRAHRACRCSATSPCSGRSCSVRRSSST